MLEMTWKLELELKLITKEKTTSVLAELDNFARDIFWCRIVKSFVRIYDMKKFDKR